MKKVIILASLICGALALTNCSDLDPLPWTQNDAFITTRYTADSTLVHGLSLYSRSNKQLASSTATSPKGLNVYEMKAYVASQPYEFVWNTPDADMTSILPSSGTYLFSALTKSDNEEVTGSDIVKKTFLLPAQIDSFAFSENNANLNIIWNSVDGADYAVIFIRNSTNKQVYTTNPILANDTTQTISESDKNWLTTDFLNQSQEVYVPTDGEQLTLEIANFKKDANDPDYLLLDARSISTYEFTWRSPIIVEETE